MSPAYSDISDEEPALPQPPQGMRLTPKGNSLTGIQIDPPFQGLTVVDADSGGKKLQTDPSIPKIPKSCSKSQELNKFLYLEQVKYKFINQPHVNETFTKIVEDFTKKRIDTPTLIARVKHLFRDHPDLMVGFNDFLLPGYKIEVESDKAVSLYSFGLYWLWFNGRILPKSKAMQRNF